MLTKKSVIVFISLFSLSLIACIAILLFSGISFGERAKAKINNESSLPHDYSQPMKAVAVFQKNFDEKAKANHTIKTVYLTFDDGPTQYTQKILTTLNKNNINGTFFMLYYPIINHPDLVITMEKEGHALGCHGVTHRVNQFYKSKNSPVNEMRACQRAIKNESGVLTHLVRVPYGSFPNLTALQKKVLDEAGFFMWDWNVDSEDWRMYHQPAKKVVDHVINQVKINEKYGVYDQVILFHDTEITSKALPKIIKKLDKMGYEFKSLSESDIPVQF